MVEAKSRFSGMMAAQTDYSTDRTFVGKIFDVYVWDKEMTDKEIKSISNYSLKMFKL